LGSGKGKTSESGKGKTFHSVFFKILGRRVQFEVENFGKKNLVGNRQNFR